MSEGMIIRRGGGGGKSGFPLFSYTGAYTFIDDGRKNWRIKFTSSGTLRISKLNGAAKGVDVFAVGGGAGGGQISNSGNWEGAGGGGGGYTQTYFRILEPDTDYPIIIGAGGAGNTDGGETSAFDITTAGGLHGLFRGGGAGGSGGGSGSASQGGAGGSDGSDGVAAHSAGGAGQGTTTKEFGETTGTLYAGGGGGGGGGYSAAYDGGAGGDGGGGTGSKGRTFNATTGTANTGGGGGGAGGYASVHAGASGGSGIVVIRNYRGA